MSKVSRVNETNKDPSQIIGCFDIGKTRQYAYAKNPRGGDIKVFSFLNNESGFIECYKRLEAFRQKEGLESILMGIESTGSYGEPLAEWMINKGVKMVGVNPKHVHRIKEVIDNSPLKSDKKDPKVGTQLIELGSYHELIRVEGVAAELRELSKHRRQQKVKETRILNQIESQIVRVFPEFVQLINTLGVTGAFLLGKYPLPKDIVDLGYEKLLKVMKEKSGYQWREDKAIELMNAAKKSVGIKEGEVSISLSISGLVEQLNLIRKQTKDIEKLLESLLEEHEEAEYILSMPEIGVVTASEIIGETGGLNNYNNAKQLIKLAGLNLYELSSGKHFGCKRITKRGRAALRHILYQAALRMIKKSGAFRHQYDQHLLNGMKKPQAIVAISKKILRVLFSVVKNQQKFQLANKKQSISKLNIIKAA